MAIQLGALRDALVEAGASAATAAKASEELAGYNYEFTSIREDMRNGFASVDKEITRLRGDVIPLRWMMGTNLLLTVGVLFRLLTH